MQYEDYLGDFFSLELVNGALLMKYETGGGLSISKEVQVGVALNDGLMHHVFVSLVEDGAMILLDNGNCSGELLCYGKTTLTPQQGQPDFFSYFYVGRVEEEGVAETFHLENTNSLICTVSELRINHQQIEYSPSNVHGLELGSSQVAACEPNPCENNGLCQDLWITYSCMCPYQYTGENCRLLAVTHLSEKSVISLNSTEGGFLTVQFEFSSLSELGVIMTVQLVSGSANIKQLNIPNLHVQCTVVTNLAKVKTFAGYVSQTINKSVWE